MTVAAKPKPSESWTENVQQYRLRWPAEPIIRFLCKTFPPDKRGQTKVLEIGCGSGRNIVAAAVEGFRAFGVEHAAPLARMTHEHAHQQGATVRLARGDALALPFQSSSFEAAIGWGLFFVLGASTPCALAEMRRVLAPGAVAFSNWRTTQDFFFAKGEPTGENTFRLDGRCKPFGLAGKRYSFYDGDTVRHVHEAAGLEVTNIERQDTWTGNLEVRNSWWHVWARKA